MKNPINTEKKNIATFLQVSYILPHLIVECFFPTQLNSSSLLVSVISRVFLSETMLNLPESLYSDPKQGGSAMSNGGAPANNSGSSSGGASGVIDWPSASDEELLLLIREPQHREKAISFLTRIKVYHFYFFMSIFLFVCVCVLICVNVFI